MAPLHFLGRGGRMPVLAQQSDLAASPQMNHLPPLRNNKESGKSPTCRPPPRGTLLPSDDLPSAVWLIWSWTEHSAQDQPWRYWAKYMHLPSRSLPTRSLLTLTFMVLWNRDPCFLLIIVKQRLHRKRSGGCKNTLFQSVRMPTIRHLPSAARPM